MENYFGPEIHGAIIVIIVHFYHVDGASSLHQWATSSPGIADCHVFNYVSKH